jgi:hypothetical protein
MSERPLVPEAPPRPEQPVHAARATRFLALAPVLTPLVTYMRRLLTAKLGRCSLCMRAALQGAVGTWLLVLVVSLLALHPQLVAVALVAALSFSGLVVAHAVAFVWRARLVVPGAPCCGC